MTGPDQDTKATDGTDASDFEQLTLLETSFFDFEHSDQASEPFFSRILAIEEIPSPLYLGSLLVGSALLIVAASFGLISWAVSGFGVAGLLATMFRAGAWITVTCGALVVVVTVMSLWPREPTLADTAAAGELSPQEESAAPQETPEGSLGIQMGELADLWNALDEPPKINRGFSLSSEPGSLDGFVLRFDQGASLAGAYDPNNDYVYALAASSRLDHEAATTMYLHLCFLLHPYSQECIDAYWDKGLEGGTPTEYLGTRHSAEWQIGSQVWRLAIVGNVQEVKVLGQPPT